MNDVTEQENEAQQRRLTDRWHVGKEIPIAFLAGLILQTFVIGWSISSLYGKVDRLVEATAELKQERYTKEDGRRDREMMQQAHEFQRQRDAEQDRRINQLEVITGQVLRGAKP